MSYGGMGRAWNGWREGQRAAEMRRQRLGGAVSSSSGAQIAGEERQRECKGSHIVLMISRGSMWIESSRSFRAGREYGLWASGNVK
jgi:hypothetical protein